MKHAFSNPDEYQSNSKLQYEFAHTMLKDANIKKSDKVLDIGCGDGKITADISELVPQGQVTGTDISNQMIDYANKKHIPNIKNNLGFMVMDAEKNIFRDQFDVVVSFCCLHWVKDQLAALKGIRGALNSQGKAVLLVPLRHEELYSAIETVVANDKWKSYFSDFINPHVFFTKTQYLQLLDKASLSPSLIEENIMEYTFEAQIEMENFLKAWLPHINRIPLSKQDEFMRDIGNQFLSIIPKRNESIIMPLKMLKIHAMPCDLQLKQKQSISFFDASASKPEENPKESQSKTEYGNNKYYPA